MSRKKAPSPHTVADRIGKLIEPQDGPYTDADAMARARELLAFYGLIAGNRQAQEAVAELCRRSFWVFLCLVAWTFDEKAIGGLKRKPFRPCWAYKIIADFLDERAADGSGWEHPKVAFYKSRQLMLSWLCMARLAWRSIHSDFASCPVISQTEDDAHEMIFRVEMLLESLPKWFRDLHGLGRAKAKSGRIELPNRSMIRSLPQRGGNAARGVVPSDAFFDEAAFQEHFELNYGAMVGTASDRRTQFLLASTANPGPYDDLVNGRVDGHNLGPAKTYHDAKGLTIRRLKGADGALGIDTIRVHYSIYAERRTPEWREQARQGVPMHVWEREQEINPYLRGGRPVFDMLDRAVHVMEAPPRIVFAPDPRIPPHKDPPPRHWLAIPGEVDELGRQWLRQCTLIRIMDHGHVRHGALWVAVDADCDWFIYRDRIGEYQPLGIHARAVHEMSNGEVYDIDLVDGMDQMEEGVHGASSWDLYRRWVADDGTRPFQRLRPPTKGAHSRAEGVDAIGTMLLSTLAAEAPSHHYWTDKGYSPAWRDSFARLSKLYVSPECEDTIQELTNARFDVRKGPDAALLSAPETTVDSKDELTDCLRYAIRAGASWIRRPQAGEAVRGRAYSA